MEFYIYSKQIITNGEELWGFIPPAIMENLSEFPLQRQTRLTQFMV